MNKDEATKTTEIADLAGQVERRVVRALDLFSGIGGFGLGFHRAGIETIAFCEIDPFCREVLQKHFPGVPIYSDVKGLTVNEEFEILCGGPPCQRTSVAAAIQGKRTGETLWYEMFRVAKATRPEWVVVEQPGGNAAWEKTVKDDLEGIGYHAARLKLEARACGAPHIRRRVFIVANAMRERCEAVARLAEPSEVTAQPWPAPPRGAWRTSGSGNYRMDDGLSGWVDRLRALGNAVVPAKAERIGRAILSTYNA